jgi:hypothetical protein
MIIEMKKYFLKAIKEEFVTFEREYLARDNYFIQCDEFGSIIENEWEPADTDLFRWKPLEIPLRTWYSCHIAECEKIFDSEVDLDHHFFTDHLDLLENPR